MYAPAWTTASARQPSSCSIIVDNVLPDKCNGIYLDNCRCQYFVLVRMLVVYTRNVKQKTSCFSFRQTRNLAMGSLTHSVLADVVVSTRDEDITVGAAGEVVPKIEHRIIRVIKQEQPLFALSG